MEYLPSSLSSVPGPYQVFFILPLTEQASVSSKTLTFYLPGGAYIRPPLPLHFSYLYELCSSTGSPICLACYPIAPLNNLEGNNVISDLTSLIKQLRIPERRQDFPKEIQEQLERCDRFCLYGDSAAGGLAFSIAFHLAQNKSDEEINQPDEIIANAPWVDLTCSHPELDLTAARHVSTDLDSRIAFPHTRASLNQTQLFFLHHRIHGSVQSSVEEQPWHGLVFL